MVKTYTRGLRPWKDEAENLNSRQRFLSGAQTIYIPVVAVNGAG